MTTSIFHRNWLRVVFEGRNQAYGAFVLRLREERRLAISMLLTVTITMGGLLLPSLIGKVDLPSLPGPVTGDLDPFTHTTKTQVQVRQTGYPQPTKSDIPIIVQKLQEIDTTHVDDTLESGPGPIGPVSTGGSPGSLSGSTTTAKTASALPDKKQPPTHFPSIPPEYPGGKSELDKFLHDNIQYPSVARANDIEGKVYVQFVVNEDGSVSDIVIQRGLAGGCNEEVIRVLKLMPKWKPGRQGPHAVPVYFDLPVAFKLN